MELTGTYIDDNGNFVVIKEWAVYLLIKNDVVVYVGCTSNIEMRISMHKSIKREFDSYTIFFQSHKKEEAMMTESMLIRYSNLFTTIDLQNKNLYSSWGKTIIKL